MLHGDDLREALALLDAISLSETFVRRVPSDKLFGCDSSGAPKVALPNYFFITSDRYRYNPKGIQVLYLGESEAVAEAEVKQPSPGWVGLKLKAREPDTVYHVKVTLEAVLDVTDAAVCAKLEFSEAEQFAPWKTSLADTETQVLGKAVFDSGKFEGILFRSAQMHALKHPGKCLVIFTERLGPKSGARLVSGLWAQTIGAPPPL